MPLINVKVIEGVFSSSQRREIVQKLTDAMVSIEGENMRGVTWCVLEEVHSGDWAIGGNALTTQDVQALAAGTGTAVGVAVGWTDYCKMSASGKTIDSRGYTGKSVSGATRVFYKP